MWIHRSEVIPDGRVVQFAWSRDVIALRPGDDGTLSNAVVLHLLSAEEEFRALFNQALAEAPYHSFRWETPAMTDETVHRSFECMLIPDSTLSPHADPQAFAEHFAMAERTSVVSFTNLGRDATLIAPTPGDDPKHAAYSSLGAFVRAAPPKQIDMLWRRVGEVMKKRVSEKPVWLNTAGGGVPWLHVRLDDRPKYYRHEPYRGE